MFFLMALKPSFEAPCNYRSELAVVESVPLSPSPMLDHQPNLHANLNMFWRSLHISTDEVAKLSTLKNVMMHTK